MSKSWSWEMTELSHLILKSVHDSCSIAGLLHPVIGGPVLSLVSLMGAPPHAPRMREGETYLHHSPVL